MNFDYQHLLPEDFSPESRVWIYQANRMFMLSEALDAEKMIEDFVSGWQSHGDDVKAYGNLLFGQFLILMADETQAMVSGCSTDSSIRFVKTLGEQFKIDFFNRQQLAFVVNDKIQMLPLAQLQYALDNGFINGDTLYFNNTILTKKALETEWLVPVKRSWLASRLGVTS